MRESVVRMDACICLEHQVYKDYKGGSKLTVCRLRGLLRDIIDGSKYFHKALLGL